MRVINRTVVLRSIREHAPISRAEIARLTSISPPTVSAIVGDLIREGLVDEHEVGWSDGGRPPRRLAFSEQAFEVGCDLSTSNILQVGVMSLHHELLDAESIPYEDAHPDPLSIVEFVADYVGRQSESRGGKARAVGVGAPGVTDVESGRIRWAPALGWRDVELATLLRERLGMPVVVDNDVNLALIGEVNRGAARQARNAVFMSFRDGVGGAVLIDGRLYRGRGGAGEVGYLVTGPHRDGDFRPFGFTEQRFFDLLAAECVARGIDVSRHSLQTQALAKLLAEDGELTLSNETRVALVETLSAALASVTALLDPEVIVLTGWIERLGNAFLSAVEDALRRLVASAPSVRNSLLGSDAVMVGAAISADRASIESAEVVATL